MLGGICLGMQSEKGVSGTNSGSLKVKTVVALVPKDVAHPQPHYNSTRKCAWIGERIIVIELSSSEAHLLYHWQVFFTIEKLDLHKQENRSIHIISFFLFQKESFMMMLTML